MNFLSNWSSCLVKFLWTCENSSKLGALWFQVYHKLSSIVPSDLQMYNDGAFWFQAYQKLVWGSMVPNALQMY